MFYFFVCQLKGRSRISDNYISVYVVKEVVGCNNL